MNVLILVDIQNDFLPGGKLAVAHGDEVVAVANALIPKFEWVVATQDWHPLNHGSFKVNNPGRQIGDTIDLHGLPQILWPTHCVQNTHGSEFAPGLNLRGAHVVQKGTDMKIDSYSGFFDNGHRKATGLEGFLRSLGAKKLFIMGLATDYCVKFTALDARSLGFDTTVIADGCRGVELVLGDCAHAFEEMQTAGVKIRNSDDYET